MTNGWVARLIGVAILIGGATLEAKGIVSALVGFTLAGLGVALALFPVLVVTLFGSLLPETWQRSVERKLGIQSTASSLSGEPNADRIEFVVRNHIDRSYRRFAVVVIILVVVIIALFRVIVPRTVKEEIAQAHLDQDAKLLIALVHENRLDYLTGDTVRGVLSLTARSFGASASQDASASLRALYDLYERLYLPENKDKPFFDMALTQLYEDRVKKHAGPDPDVLKAEALGTDDPKDPDGRVALLTFLGFLCNEQGVQGQFLTPYLYGRQFLERAHAIARVGTAPGLHHARGWNYADTLKLYDEYARKYRDAARSSANLASEAQPLSKLRLAKNALDEFEHGRSASTSSFSAARFFNNLTDLRLSLIRQVHVDNTITAKDAVDDADRSFLAKLGLNVMSGEATPVLWDLLQEIHTDMSQAAKLVHQPPIFFTRAQVYATEGELRTRLQGDRTDPAQIDRLLEAAYKELQTARQLGVPKEYFMQARAEQMYLGWLWRQDNLRPRLERLVD